MQNFETLRQPFWGFEQRYWLNLVIFPVESGYMAVLSGYMAVEFGYMAVESGYLAVESGYRLYQK